jgi:uncharacterized membrane protein (DUF485 family)
MQDPMVERILSNPKYQQLKRTRTRFGWTLTIIMLVVYYAYVALFAFDKSLLATPIAEGMVTSWGVPIGIFIIVFSIVIVGIYVRRANGEFSALTREILEEATK